MPDYPESDLNGNAGFLNDEEPDPPFTQEQESRINELIRQRLVEIGLIMGAAEDE